jgi:hypothetical protein
VLKKLGGNRATILGLKSLTHTTNATAPGLARCHCKYFYLTDEASTSFHHKERISTSVIQTLTGSTVAGEWRALYLNGTDVICIGVSVIACNKLPKYSDVTQALITRMRILLFPNVWHKQQYVTRKTPMAKLDKNASIDFMAFALGVLAIGIPSVDEADRETGHVPQGPDSALLAHYKHETVNQEIEALVNMKRGLQEVNLSEGTVTEEMFTNYLRSMVRSGHITNTMVGGLMEKAKTRYAYNEEYDQFKGLAEDLNRGPRRHT